MEEILTVDMKRGAAIYLGYELKLTPTELQILAAILEREDGVSSQELLDSLLGDRRITCGNIAVHVCNINKKARMIGGRSIVSDVPGHGYCIAEYL